MRLTQIVMSYTLVIVAFVLAVALLPLTQQCRRSWPRLGYVVFGFWFAIPVVAVYVANAWENSRVQITEQAIADRPREIPRDGYVQSRSCRACHLDEYSSWHRSYHRTMTQVASPTAVLGDFNDVELRVGNSSYRLSREGDKYFVDIKVQTEMSPGTAGGSSAARTHRGEIVMTTGSHHMQAYWYTSGNGRLTVQLPFVWLRPEKAWIVESHSFLKPDERHRSDKMSNWNTTCINCHTTHGCQGGVQVTPKLDTVAAEFGIACESCHGPGETHVAANRNPVTRYQSHLSDGDNSTIHNPANMDHRKASEVCGACHAGARLFASADVARRAKTHGRLYRPGGELSDERLILQPRGGTTLENPLVRSVLRGQPQLLKGRFWSDGLARVSGTEYNGMIDSPCYRHGEMSCLSCHTMHPSGNDPQSIEEWADDQLKPGMRGNEACLQCHIELSSSDSLTAHTGHLAESPGSSCYNCHMPYSTFGLLKAIRSHTVTSPSAHESLLTGRPNACNQCHLDKTLEWTAQKLESMFNVRPPNAMPLAHTEVAGSVMWTLTGDAGQRALMAWSLGWQEAHEDSGSDWQAPYLAQLLSDPYPAVRIVAYRSLIRLPQFSDFKYDLMGTQTHRDEARRRALDIWRAARESRKGKNGKPTVLIAPDGSIQQERFDELSSKRDDRFVSLEE